jgi:hypothetical protein
MEFKDLKINTFDQLEVLAPDWMMSRIESMLLNSTLSVEDRADIEKSLLKISEKKGYEIIQMLEASQQHPIREKGSASLTEINREIKQILKQK